MKIMAHLHRNYNFSEIKNLFLKMEIGISFEEIIYAIDNGQVLDNIEHPNQQRYPDHYLMIVECNDYVYVVPYVERDEEIFLKTIYPSRKAKRDFKRGKLW